LVEKCEVLVVNREALRLKDLLMSGTFGQVWTGVFDASGLAGRFSPSGGARKVYVKTVTGQYSISIESSMVGIERVCAVFATDYGNECTTNTVRLSNFDRRDPKTGVFLQSTEAIPCGHLIK
jgi:hypothetical protein